MHFYSLAQLLTGILRVIQIDGDLPENVNPMQNLGEHITDRLFSRYSLICVLFSNYIRVL